MKCEQVIYRLDAFADGELAGEKVDRITAHIAECPTCRSVLAEIDRCKKAIAAIKLESPSRRVLKKQRDMVIYRIARLARTGQRKIE